MSTFEGFCGPTYATRSPTASPDRCINFMPERREIEGAHPWILSGTPGLRAFAQLQVGPVRGLYETQGRVFAAGRSLLYEISASGAATALGAIEEGTSQVTFADNGTQICIVSGHTGYILVGSTLTQITSEGLPAISQVKFLDGYFIGLEPDSRRIHVSALLDGFTWDALDYKDRMTSPDEVVAIEEDHGELWVFGEKKSEVWATSESTDQLLYRIGNARLELGCGAPNSIAKLDNSIFWLGNDERGNRVIWRATGYSATRISNHSAEDHLNRFGTIDSAVAWTYQEEGHSFYCIQFPNEPRNSEITWVYDVATGMWHERGYWNKIYGQYETHRARCHAFAWNKHLVGDRENGKVYEQSMSLYDDDGDRIRRIRIAPHIVSEQKTIYYSKFRLHMDVAVGLGVIDTARYGPDAQGLEYRQ